MDLFFLIKSLHRRAFEERQLTQKDLAELAGIDPNTLVGFKDDPEKWAIQGRPSTQTILKLERALEIA